MLSLFSEVTKTAVSWCIIVITLCSEERQTETSISCTGTLFSSFAVELTNFMCPIRHFSKLPSELKRFQLWYQDVYCIIDVYIVHLKFTYKQIQLYSVLKSGKP